MATHKHIIIEFGYNETTLWDSIRFFWDGAEYFLAVIIFFFTILFPVLKFFHLGGILFYPQLLRFKIFHITKYLADKWSMLDVFIIALVIFHIKMNSQIVVTSMEIGTTFLAISILFRMMSSELAKESKIQNEEE